MKILLLLGAFFLVAAEKNCKGKKDQPVPDNCFKGRLEIKANCMNYTISIVDGSMDTSLYVPSWTDDNTGKAYKNVFALGSRCSFPNNINEGDEFYFIVDSSSSSDCAVCMMYYPVPRKKLSIKVISDPCTQ